MSWCAADVTRGDEMWEEVDCTGMTALWCKSHLLFLLFSCTPFSFYLSFPPPPLCHRLHHFLFLTPPLPFTLSSLQEVLELAFSVLYESDEYLNFIAPDKHEVSQHRLALNKDSSQKEVFFSTYICSGLNICVLSFHFFLLANNICWYLTTQCA